MKKPLLHFGRAQNINEVFFYNHDINFPFLIWGACGNCHRSALVYYPEGLDGGKPFHPCTCGEEAMAFSSVLIREN